MVVRFGESLGRDDGSSANSYWSDEGLMAVAGYVELMSTDAGSSCGGGVYRLHTESSAMSCQRSILHGFGGLAATSQVFGYDWLGRQFAVDLERPASEQVVMFEPGTGQRLAIPVSFATFHSDELVDYADEALALDFFAEWKRSTGAGQPLAIDECVGYRIPLFLGGLDDVPNLEVGNLDVSLELTMQLLAGVAGSESGTEVTGVSDDGSAAPT